jgi:hypothetical protein
MDSKDTVGDPIIGDEAELIKIRSKGLDDQRAVLNSVAADKHDWAMTITKEARAGLLEGRQSPEVCFALIETMAGIMGAAAEEDLGVFVECIDAIDRGMSSLHDMVMCIKAGVIANNLTTLAEDGDQEAKELIGKVVSEFLKQMEKQDETSNSNVSGSGSD